MGAVTLPVWLIVALIAIDLIAMVLIGIKLRAVKRDVSRSIDARFDRLERFLARRFDELSFDRSASPSRPSSDRSRAIDSCEDARESDKISGSVRDSVGREGPVGATSRFGFRSDSSGRDVRIRVDERRTTRADAAKPPAISTLIEIPDVTSKGGVAAPSDALIEFENRFGLIWGMADEGRGEDEIARATGYPIGQIELILGLRGRSASASRSDT